MSRNFNRPMRFIGFIKNPMSISEINTIYKFNKVKHVRSELYSDFVQSLCDIVFNTYMGDDVTKDKDREKHFIWCWNKVIFIFKELGYDLSDVDNEKKYGYFYSFFLDVFYEVEDKNADLEYNIKNVWQFVFQCDVEKSQKDVDNFLDIYNMFDETQWYRQYE